MQVNAIRTLRQNKVAWLYLEKYSFCTKNTCNIFQRLNDSLLGLIGRLDFVISRVV